MDIRNINFIEEDYNKKTRLYVYTAHLLDTPQNVPVHQMTLDLDNGPPGVVLQIGGGEMMILLASWIPLVPTPA